MPDNLRLKRGDTWSTTWTWAQSTGDPVDLTGCTARLQVRDRRTKELLASASTTTGELTITPATGVVSCTIDPDVTKDFPIKTCAVDLELTYSDGTVQSTDTVYLVVVEDVTHDG